VVIIQNVLLFLLGIFEDKGHCILNTILKGISKFDTATFWIISAICIIYKNSLRTSESTRCASVIKKNSRWILYTERISVCRKKNTEYINTLCGEKSKDFRCSLQSTKQRLMWRPRPSVRSSVSMTQYRWLQAYSYRPGGKVTHTSHFALQVRRVAVWYALLYMYEWAIQSSSFKLCACGVILLHYFLSLLISERLWECKLFSQCPENEGPKIKPFNLTMYLLKFFSQYNCASVSFSVSSLLL
jgi:hypothetical protein